jgi:hypothetical protein
MRGRPKARARGRGVVGWLLAGLVVSQFALSVVQECWRPELRDPEFGNKLELLHRQSAAEPDRPLLLALGSSRTLNGLHPDLLPPDGPRVFNFGMIWHGPVRQALALDRVLRDGVRPRWVTIELAPLLMQDGGREFDRVPAAQFSWGDVRFVRDNAFRPPTVAAEWLEARLLPSYASRFSLICHLLPTWVSWTQRHDFFRTNTLPDGWVEVPSAPSTESAETTRAHMTTLVGGQLRAFAMAEDSVRALRGMLERCRAEGIGVSVVLMPEASWFRELLPAAGERQVQGLIDEVKREFGVAVIDARGWCPDDDFRDGHHLIASGAAHFTERFGRDIVPTLPIASSRADGGAAIRTRRSRQRTRQERSPAPALAWVREPRRCSNRCRN